MCQTRLKQFSKQALSLKLFQFCCQGEVSPCFPSFAAVLSSPDLWLGCIFWLNTHQEADCFRATLPWFITCWLHSLAYMDNPYFKSKLTFKNPSFLSHTEGKSMEKALSPLKLWVTSLRFPP